MKRRILPHASGFTLVELVAAMGIGAVVLTFICDFLGGSAQLFARNLSTNLTHNSTRFALDRLGQEVTQADGSLKLITPTGTTVSTGSAAGIRFDVLRADPYILVHPGGTGLLSTATTLTLRRTTSTASQPLLPAPGDVILADDASTVRLKVLSCTAGTPSAGLQDVSVNLQSAPGTAISWSASYLKAAHVVRQVAYVVVPSSGRNELRYFPNAETITDFSTATGYTVILRNIATGTGDATPFSNLDFQGRTFVRFVLRVRGDNELALKSKEANQFSSIQRVDFLLTPRGA